MKFLTLDDVEVENKTVFVRVDLNCPVENGVVQKSPRLVAHAKTLFELMQKKAKVVVLAHQGRSGKPDFISLSQHAKLLSSEISKLSEGNLEVQFVDDVAGEKAKNSVETLASGQILLLENVRFLDSEIQFSKTNSSELVANLSPFCEIFVLDAFSVSHRSQASVIGFDKCPAVAGRVMTQELSALSHFENPKRPTLLILGGAKPADSLPIMRSWLESGRADNVLCGGAMGHLMLIASGQDIGVPSEDFLKKSGSLQNPDELEQFYEKYGGKLHIPWDVVLDEKDGAKTIDSDSLPSQSAILDIGIKTRAEFSKIISSAGSIVLNGPMGVYEKDEFSGGTRSILEAVADSSAFSLLGGGHTLSALDKFGISFDMFGYVSLSGKALVEYLSGVPLPGVQLLEKTASSS